VNLESLNGHVYLNILTPHDFLFFSSREYNAISFTEKIINNYALIYALNSIFQEVDIYRTVSGVRPHYLEDFKKIQIYSTAAYRFNAFKRTIRSQWKRYPEFLKQEKTLIKDLIFFWDEAESVGFTYNAIGESCALKMEKIRFNFPNLGKYYKLPPLSTFISFSVGARPPSLVRLGKKLIPCRIHSFSLENIQVGDGIFSPNHPINLSELPPETIVRGGTPLYMQPTSLLLNGELKGKYIIGEIDGLKCTIVFPNPKRYPTIFDITKN